MNTSFTFWFPRFCFEGHLKVLLGAHFEVHFGVQEGEVSPCLQPRYAGSSATPSPKGSALKNLDAENTNSLLDHFADVGKMAMLTFCELLRSFSLDHENDHF